MYLALDEIYHPFWAAISNNPTRRDRDTEPGKRKSKTGFSPSMIPCSKRFIPAPPEINGPIDYNSPRNCGDFRLELFPLHSPLLRESLLVSFPPLSYMLKFSGWSCLISGQDMRGEGFLRVLSHTQYNPKFLRFVNKLIMSARALYSQRPCHITPRSN